MRQRDIDNAMIVLKTLVKHHQAYEGEPLSALKVYQTSRAVGQGWLRSVDLSRTFTVGAERLVEVGLAIRVPGRTRHDRAFSPSPIGVLVTFQHPARFPRPAAPDRDRVRRSKDQPHSSGWRMSLIAFQILLSVVGALLAQVGAPRSVTQWPIGFAIVCGLIVLLIPRGAFRLRR